MRYRRCGQRGIELPMVSLGLWHNFGADRRADEQEALVRHAFDLGITHFDLANNYGPPPGAAESFFGRVLARPLRGHRDELIITTKAGYDMWPGRYGRGGSRKHVLASLDQSLRRLGVDYVDVFYSHCVDPEVPIEETMGALAHAVESGRALYAGISSYSAQRTQDAITELERCSVPLLVHQASYSMFNRWIESGLLEVLGARGVGCVAFSPLAQGLLTSRYLAGIPAGARASLGKSLDPQRYLTDDNLARVRSLATIAERRGHSLAQLAITWALRDARVSSVVVGASGAGQLTDSVEALEHLDFTAEELAEIDTFAVDGDVNLWQRSSEA